MARKRSPAKPAARARRPSAASPEGAPPETAELARLVASLDEVAAGLQYAHQSFQEAVLHLPRAEDYEPLAAPLREFARTSPALVDAMREVMKAAGPLAGLLGPLTAVARGLEEAVASVEATGRQLTAALAAVPGATTAPAEEIPRLTEVANRVGWAYEAIEEALASLPHDADYAPFAAQLRELATVSPSLMEWLQEVPKVATPLAAAVGRLRDAAAELKVVRTLLREPSPEKGA
jgi:hypothetical protein